MNILSQDLFGNPLESPADHEALGGKYRSPSLYHEPLAQKIRTAGGIIAHAIMVYDPVHVLVLVSGGNDSVANLIVSANWLRRNNVPFTVYHGDTTIGLRETQEYVVETCKREGFGVAVRKPYNGEDHYESLIGKFGLPGPTRQSHAIMYRRLKERGLRHYVTHEVKSTAKGRENVLLLSGVRWDESQIRMGYGHVMSKEYSRIWCNPCFWFSSGDCNDVMEAEGFARNPVKKAICISGECLCGCYATKSERAEIKYAFPYMDERLSYLESVAEAAGFPWKWGSRGSGGRGRTSGTSTTPTGSFPSNSGRCAPGATGGTTHEGPEKEAGTRIERHRGCPPPPECGRLAMAPRHGPAWKITEPAPKAG